METGVRSQKSGARSQESEVRRFELQTIHSCDLLLRCSAKARTRGETANLYNAPEIVSSTSFLPRGSNPAPVTGSLTRQEILCGHKSLVQQPWIPASDQARRSSLLCPLGTSFLHRPKP